MKETPIVAALLTILLPGCGRNAPDLLVAIPPGTRAIAGVRLEDLKAIPALARLRERLPAVEGASTAIAAWDGAELLVAAAGGFAAPPAGATMAAPGVALFGSPGKVAAALSQYRSGQTGAAALAALARRDRSVWAVVRGDVTLPLTGNAANLDRIIQLTEYTTVAIKTAPAWELEAEGHCRNPGEAERLRETIGGMLLLAGVKERPNLERQDRTVRLSLVLSQQAAASMVDTLLRGR